MALRSAQSLEPALCSEMAQRLDAVIEARREAGVLDTGLETVRADRIKKDSERGVYKDPESGAETRYVKLTLSNRFKPETFDLSRGLGFGGGDKIVGHESAVKWQVDPMRFLTVA